MQTVDPSDEAVLQTFERALQREKPLLGQARAGIWIVSKKNGRCAHGHSVASPSVLGCNYAQGRRTRLEVIAAYRDWLREQWRLRGPAREALYVLAREYAQTGTLTLVCWCAPKPCHAEVIRDAVIGIVKRGSGK